VTCATDTNNMEFVLESTRTIIMTDVSGYSFRYFDFAFLSISSQSSCRIRDNILPFDVWSIEEP
jgi:hypothetical protein